MDKRKGGQFIECVIIKSLVVVKMSAAIDAAVLVIKEAVDDYSLDPDDAADLRDALIAYGNKLNAIDVIKYSTKRVVDKEAFKARKEARKAEKQAIKDAAALSGL